MTQGNLSEAIHHLLFTRIFKSFRMAIQPSKLLIALLAILAVCVVGLVLDIYKVVDAAPATTSAEISSLPMPGSIATAFPTELHAFLASPDAVDSFTMRYHDQSNRLGLFRTLATFNAARFNAGIVSLVALNPVGTVENLAMSARSIEWALTLHPLYSLLYLAVIFAIMAFAGGAICRLAALEFAKNEKPGFFQALRFAREKYKAFLAAPLLPLALIAVFVAIIALIGLIGNIPYAGEIIVSLLLGLALVLGFLITLAIIGAAAGANLMYPTIAFESSDSFDAISRSFSYVYDRPWRMIFYTLVAAVYGALCYLFVWVFTLIMLAMTYLGLWTGMLLSHGSGFVSTNKLEAIWPNPKTMSMPGSIDTFSLNWSETIAAYIISVFVTIVFCMLVAFVISFFFSANTIIYALLRNKVDNTALSDVSMPRNNADVAPSDDLPTDSDKTATQ